MVAERFVAALNKQISYEFGASQQYIAAAVYYDAQTLTRLAGFFYDQAAEERTHALMMIRYLLDSGVQATVPGIEAPKTSFGSFVQPIEVALEQERKVADQISELASIAREEKDYLSDQFVQWFLKEQVEEISLMSSLLDVARRAGDQPLLVEDFLAREGGLRPEGADPTAPPAAGG